MNLIDLHTHTTASDGSLSPAELVNLARRLGLKAVAVTDHDTIAGLPEALAAGRALNYEAVPGIEISAEFRPGSMHILGYFIDPADLNLNQRLGELQQARRTRNIEMLGRLKTLGLKADMEDIEAAAGGGQIGRPHFARVMTAKGFVTEPNEAFELYLKRGRPAHVEKFRLGPAEALTLIRRAGGLPVLAHPATLRLNGLDALEDLVAELKNQGLAGIEVYYSDHTRQMAEDFLALARKYDLLPTGGSDFHGENKPGVELGRGRGDLAVPYDFLAGLKQQKGESR